MCSPGTYRLGLVALFVGAGLGNLLAQDTLITIHGETLPVKLLQVNETENLVNYKLHSTDSAIQHLALNEVFLIRYGNGDRQAFPAHLEFGPEVISGRPSGKSLTQEQLYRLGVADARAYYNPLPAGFATATGAAVNPLIGLIAVSAVKAPTWNSSRVPRPELMKERAYRIAYQSEAKRMKQKAGLLGAGIGSIAWILLFL